MKKLKINSAGADLKRLDELLEFQGDIKKLAERSHEKLRKAILRQGFSAPFHIWRKDGESTNKILDGHQRLKVLYRLRDDGYKIPPLPVDYVDAETEKEAKEKLLTITSQYGDFSINGIDQYVFEAELNIGEISDHIRILEGKEHIFEIEATMPEMEDGDREPYQNMTFHLHDDQVEIIKKALRKAISDGPFDNTLNPNSNGNALERIARKYNAE